MRERDPPVGTFHCPSVTSTHSLFLMNLKQYKGWSSVVFCSRERYSIILHFWKSFLTTCSSCGPTDHQAPELCLICTSASDRHTCHIIQHFQNRGKAFILHIFSFLRRTALYITNRQESLPPCTPHSSSFRPSSSDIIPCRRSFISLVAEDAPIIQVIQWVRADDQRRDLLTAWIIIVERKNFRFDGQSMLGTHIGGTRSFGNCLKPM